MPPAPTPATAPGIVPGYIDLQVNGYFGVDFNQDDLTAAQLHEACARLEADGVAGILATIVTEQLDRMAPRLSNLVRLRQRDELARRIIVGIHIEGPFLNETPGYRGAHPPEAIRPADPDAMQRLLDAAGGLTKIVTLAPERDPRKLTTNMLARRGITVAGGHSDAALDELRAALDAGLSMWTHLGNGCPMQLHRHDNIIQRVLSVSDRLTPTFIADGAHVAFPALRNYLKLVGLDRAVVVTDAVTAAGLGPGKYKINQWEIEVGEDLVTWGPGKAHLVGCAAPMRVLVDNLVNHVGLTRAEALRLTVENPGRFV